MTPRERVKALHEAHPDWTGARLADELGMSSSAVHQALSRLGIRLSGKRGRKPKAAAPRQRVALPMSAKKPERKAPMAYGRAGPRTSGYTRVI